MLFCKLRARTLSLYRATGGIIGGTKVRGYGGARIAFPIGNFY